MDRWLQNVLSHPHKFIYINFKVLFFIKPNDFKDIFFKINLKLFTRRIV